jgi:hypothetical protein
MKITIRERERPVVAIPLVIMLASNVYLALLTYFDPISSEGFWYSFLFSVWFMGCLITHLSHRFELIITLFADAPKIHTSASTRQPEAKKRITQAPGSKLLLIAIFLYPPQTVEGIFKPLVGDWRTEYFGALKQGQTIKARWISARYIYSFFFAMGLSKVFSLVKIIIGR